MSILFAATYPERVTSLILVGSAARWSFAPDYACGRQSNEMLSALDELAASRWGQGESIEWYAPSLADVPRARQAFAHWERLAVTPSALQRMLRMIRAIDVRSVLAAIRVPALVIQRQGDRVAPQCQGRYLADHLPRARYFEQPGDHVLWLGDTDASTALVPTGRSTAAQIVRVATSTTIVKSARTGTPESSSTSTSIGVESICTCSPGRAACVGVNMPCGRLAVCRRVTAEPNVCLPDATASITLYNVDRPGSGTTPGP